MIYLTKIAWRNLTRNKLRSLVAILAVAVVVMIVVFTRGLMVGFNESMFNFYIDNQLGHVRIIDEDYRLREALLPLDYTVDGFTEAGLEDMREELNRLTQVEHVLPRLRFGAMASIDDSLVRMAGVGVDPAAEQEYGNLVGEIKEGRLPETGNEILVGQGLLEDLQAEVGSRVTITFSDSYQSLRGRTFDVVGVRDSGVAQLDDHFFYLPLATAQDILYLEDEATEVLVFGADYRQADKLEAEINTLMTNKGETESYSVQIWDKADPMIETLREMTGTMNFVYIFFILLGTIVLITTMTMIVRERTTEIGMMAALGLKQTDIMKIFTLEGAFLGLIGSFTGVIGGGLITRYFGKYGIRVEPLMEAVQEMDVLFEPVIYTAFNRENLLISFLMAVVIVTLACLYPAYKAAKLEPVDALDKEE